AKAAGTPAAQAEKKEDSTSPKGAAPSGGDRSLDQMILDYLASDDVPEDVAVTLSPSPDFLAGRPVQTRLKAGTGSPPRPPSRAGGPVPRLSTAARASALLP